jgi:predicted AAA+ superfamily ATPase
MVRQQNRVGFLPATILYKPCWSAAILRCCGALEPRDAGLGRAITSKQIVQRDVRDIADVERLDRLPPLLQVLAHHSGQLINFTQIGGQLRRDDKTTRKYIAVFEQLFLIRRVPPRFRNKLNRLVKTPKLHFLDSGLLAATINITSERVARTEALSAHCCKLMFFRKS